ncbi:hypothetical protein [Mycolicibacterium fortuitum]|uniref:hypothetical protein n=1 Tax=Mycolicibacterium fortuitum TaxID=1766 RepID=UPI00261258BD|nr:hypothetical protein [Mycolicibacterium fortuitum]
MDYFTADLHLAHPKLASLRGFETVAAHDAAVMAPLHHLDPSQTRCGFWATSVPGAWRPKNRLWRS